MTGLLVSVRSAGEAAAAVRGGATLIDIKEPARGSLGPADVAVWREIAAEVRGQRPLSVALGEITDACAAARAAQTTGFHFAKLGLAGACQLPNWQARWRQVREQLAPAVTPVAVIYADWQPAAAPAPRDVLRTAVELGCRVVLIDTFDKAGGDLFARLSHDELHAIAREAQQQDFALALAGSLRAERFADALCFAPTWLAVRGAACDGDRTGPISAERVRLLSSSLARQTRTASVNSRSLA